MRRKVKEPNVRVMGFPKGPTPEEDGVALHGVHGHGILKMLHTSRRWSVALYARKWVS